MRTKSRLRNIGPAYVDKVNRKGIRIVDLLDRKALPGNSAAISKKNEYLNKICGVLPLDPEAIVDEYHRDLANWSIVH